MLNIDNVNCSFMISFTDEMVKNSLVNNKAFANAWILKAKKIAEEIGQRADFPELFSDVTEQELKEVDLLNTIFINIPFHI